MGELYEPYPKLPKNIRQIGEQEDIVRVYAEDYVNTYLKRLFPTAGQDLRAGLLLGNTEEHGGIPYVFIDGALEMEGITEEGEKVVFSEESWKHAYQTVEEMFPKRTVQGWFLCGVPGCQLSPLNYWKQHSQYFAGKNKLMYLNSGLEGEEAIYITSSDGFYKLRGYCIYYERNQMMQDYMVMRKENRRVEDGGSDPVIRSFRRKMEQKKEHADDQTRTIQFLRGMCGCLAVLTLAGGVAAFNSAEKMKDMEAVMASVLPEAEAVWDAGKNRISQLRTDTEAQNRDNPDKTSQNKNQQSREVQESSGMIIEEASGNIFPTVDAQKESYPPSAESPKEESPQPEGQAAAENQLQEQTSAQTTAVSNSASSSENKHTQGADEGVEDNHTEPSEGNELSTEQGGNSQETAENSSSVSQSESKPAETKTTETKPAESVSSTAAKPARQKEPKPGQGVYVVQQGETLYGICFKLYQNINRVDEICEINGITDVNMLEAGFRLIVP